MNKLAIFDLDGTLFDTGEVNFFSYQKALNKVGYDVEKKCSSHGRRRLYT